jgi:hypothetical protein
MVGFKGSPPIRVRISPKSTVIVYYESDDDVKKVLGLLKKHGVPRCGSEIFFKLNTWTPPFDEMKSTYVQFVRGHLQHNPWCLACLEDSFASKFFPLQQILANADLVFERVMAITKERGADLASSEHCSCEACRILRESGWLEEMAESRGNGRGLLALTEVHAAEG